jgi:hypothetical protein
VFDLMACVGVQVWLEMLDVLGRHASGTVVAGGRVVTALAHSSSCVLLLAVPMHIEEPNWPWYLVRWLL